jgi:hypothetical protein
MVGTRTMMREKLGKRICMCVHAHAERKRERRRGGRKSEVDEIMLYTAVFCCLCHLRHSTLQNCDSPNMSHTHIA